MAVVYVQILSLLVPAFVIVELFTLDKVLLSAVNVGNPLSVSVTCIVIRDFTLGNVPMHAVNLGNSFLAFVMSVVMTECTLQ